MISLDNRVNSTLIEAQIKQYKSDPFRNGATLNLGAIKRLICPVAGILPYLALRGSQPAPLSHAKEGQGLTHHFPGYCAYKTWATLMQL